jgi:hypothetical protein
MSITYTILDEQRILFNKDNNAAPFLVQTTWPNGQPWSNPSEMNSWARLKVAELETEAAPFAPKGPGEVGKNKPTKKSLKSATDALKSAKTLEEHNAAKAALSALYR